MSSFFYRSDALPVAQPTVSKHWRKKSLMKIYHYNNWIPKKERVADRFLFPQQTQQWQHYSMMCLYFCISFTSPLVSRHTCFHPRRIPVTSVSKPHPPNLWVPSSPSMCSTLSVTSKKFPDYSPMRHTGLLWHSLTFRTSYSQAYTKSIDDAIIVMMMDDFTTDLGRFIISINWIIFRRRRRFLSFSLCIW